MTITSSLPLLILIYLGSSSAKIETSTIEKDIEEDGTKHQCTFHLEHDDEESVLDLDSSSVECSPATMLPRRVSNVGLEDDEGHIFMVDFQMSPDKILQAEYEGLTPQEEFQAQEIIEVDDGKTYPCSAQDPRLDDEEDRGVHVSRGSVTTWPNGIIPYVFDYPLTKQDRLTFAKAFQQIEAKTCVRFRPRRSEKYFLWVVRQCHCKKREKGKPCVSGAFASIGMGRPAKLTVGGVCLQPGDASDVGLVVHELLHTLGIGHTQTRPDRGNHIWVYKNRIEQNMIHNFAMCKNCKLHGTPYDCRSIMHYRDWFFELYPGKPVMAAKNPRTCDLKKGNNYLTKADIQLINGMYPCQGSKPTHGGWSYWSAWSTCRAQSHYRFRSCSNPKPANEGRRCTGKDKETKECTATTTGSDGCPEENKNTRGRRNTQMIDGAHSWGACAEMCAGKSGCTYWTWHHEGAGKPYAYRCLLMGGYSSKAQDTNAISGTVSCRCPEKDTNTRGRGQSQKMNTNTWQECAAMCKKTAFCTYWTWHHVGAGNYYKRCILMAGFGNKATDTNAISGSKKCTK